MTNCPKCNGEYVYFDGALYVCPDCGHEFNEEEATATETVEVAKDSNGAELFDGDAVTFVRLSTRRWIKCGKLSDAILQKTRPFMYFCVRKRK